VPDAGPLWQLEGFLERLDSWIEQESPSDDLRLIVTAWILTRFDDPYQGVRREPEFGNLWFGMVPRSRDDQGTIVTCAYWIEESRGTVRCDSFATLRLPT
jgi:hypothetical protein